MTDRNNLIERLENQRTRLCDEAKAEILRLQSDVSILLDQLDLLVMTVGEDLEHEDVDVRNAIKERSGR
jgi:hypothetical protein